MIKPIVNTWTIVLVLTVLNTFFIFLFKAHKKFYVGQTILFAFALVSFLLWNYLIFPHQLAMIETARNADAVLHGGQTSNEVWLSTRKTEDFLYSLNKPAFEITVFQTALTFLFSLIGLRLTTEKKLFRRTSIVFGVLTLLFLFAYIIASFASTGMVT